MARDIANHHAPGGAQVACDERRFEEAPLIASRGSGRIASAGGMRTARRTAE